MGVLDDLRAQADGQRVAEEEESARISNREQFYRDEIRPRMVKAYQFFKELAEHLNYIKVETIVEYPLYSDGQLQPMRQQGYAVLIDSSKKLKQIDLTFQCVLDDPVSFDLYNKDAILNLSDRLDRYYIKYKRHDKKNKNMQLEMAKFVITGPLPLKVGIMADIANSEICIAIRNFTDPGTSTHIIKPEEFDDSYLDRLGKFVLRKDDSLFGSTNTTSEISEEAKAKIREKMQQERLQRVQELKEAEERGRREEEARKQNSKKELLKKAVNAQVEEKKEKLKTMFNKLKKQAGFDSTPEQKQSPTTAQVTQRSPVPPAAQINATPQKRVQPAATAHTRQQIQASPSATVHTAQQAQVPPAGPKRTGQQEPVAPAPAKLTRSSKSPVVDAASKPQATIDSATVESASPAPATVDSNIKQQQEPVPPAMPAANKKTQPPKIYNAPADNPFLKPEPAEESPVATSDQQDDSSEGNPKPAITPEDLEKDLARIIDRDKSGVSEEKTNVAQPTSTPSKNPFLTPPPHKPAALSGQKSSTAEGEKTSNPFLQTSATRATVAPMPAPSGAVKTPNPILKPGELNTDLSANLTTTRDVDSTEDKPAPKANATREYPFLKSDELDIDLSENVVPPQTNNEPEEKS